MTWLRVLFLKVMDWYSDTRVYVKQCGYHWRNESCLNLNYTPNFPFSNTHNAFVLQMNACAFTRRRIYSFRCPETAFLNESVRICALWSRYKTEMMRIFLQCKFKSDNRAVLCSEPLHLTLWGISSWKVLLSTHYFPHSKFKCPAFLVLN